MVLDRRHRIVVLCVLAVAIASLRLIHLAADTPPTLWTEGMGEFVDEGTKTLAPRNLAVHGRLRWNPADDYPGWMKASPVTQSLFYLSFLLLGPTIEAAKLVTLAWFVVFLLAYAFELSHANPIWLGALGILLLGLIHPLFLYSGNALFEVPLIVCLFGSLLVLKKDPHHLGRRALLVLLAVAVLATLGVKRSALLYFLPVLLALPSSWLARKAPGTRRRRTAVLAVLALVLAGLAFATSDVWQYRLAWSPRNFVAGLFANALMESSPPIVMLGLFSAAFLLLRAPEIALRPFPLALISIVVLAPAMLGLFESRPLRYFIPLIPAYPLLLVECWRWRPWERRREVPEPTWARGLALICLVFASAAMFHFLNRFVLGLLGFAAQSSPGYQAPIELRYLTAGSVIVGSGLWLLRRTLLRPRIAKGVLSVAVALTLLLNGLLNARFLLAPTYERRDLSAGLDKVVPSGASVIGNLAPFLFLGTEVPTLIMLGPFNRVARITSLQPDYFLYSGDDAEMDAARQAISEMPGVDLAEPVFEGEFKGRPVLLYPLAYRSSAPSPPGRPAGQAQGP